MLQNGSIKPFCLKKNKQGNGVVITQISFLLINQGLIPCALKMEMKIWKIIEGI